MRPILKIKSGEFIATRFQEIRRRQPVFARIERRKVYKAEHEGYDDDPHHELRRWSWWQRAFSSVARCFCPSGATRSVAPIDMIQCKVCPCLSEESGSLLYPGQVYKHWLFYFMSTNSPITNAGIAKQRPKIRPLVSLSIFRPRIAACLNSSVHAHRGAAEWSLVEWARLGERTTAHARTLWRNANMAMRFPDRVYCCNSAPLEKYNHRNPCATHKLYSFVHSI